MRRIDFILLISFITFNIFAIDNNSNLSNPLYETKGYKKAKLLYQLAAQSDSLETTEKIEYCSQSKKIAYGVENKELLFDILLLESSLFKEILDIEKYSLSIEEYIKLLQETNKLKIKNSKDQILKQIRIKNSFIFGFLILFNIAFVVLARYSFKTANQIKLEKANKQLEVISRKDPLTSISNRRDILEKINHEAIRHERNKKAFSLVMGDLDHFKLVNDKHGHDCGDDLLIKIASTIVSSIRKQDIVGRWGGEEFLLLLPETNLEGGRITAEKVRKKIEQSDFIYNDNIVPITITFGVSEYSNNKGVELCIKEADTALYKGKSTGRNRVDVFQPKDILIG